MFSLWCLSLKHLNLYPSLTLSLIFFFFSRIRLNLSLILDISLPPQLPPYSLISTGAILDAGESQVVFLPLMTHDAKLLPVHFITQAEVGHLRLAVNVSLGPEL